MNNGLLYIVYCIGYLFSCCLVIDAADQVVQKECTEKAVPSGYELSVTQKILLYEKAAARNWSHWHDHDSRTVDTLRLVNKELRDAVDSQRSKLAKKYPDISLSKPIFNRYGEWCSFGHVDSCKQKAHNNKIKRKIFFGNNIDERYSIRICDALFQNIIPISTKAWSGFYVQNTDGRTVIVIPSKKRTWSISLDNQSTLYNAGIAGIVKEKIPFIIESIIKKFIVCEGNLTTRSGIDSWCAASKVSTKKKVLKSMIVNIDCMHPVIKGVLAHVDNLAKMQLNNSECACTAHNIDSACQDDYEQLYAFFTQQGLTECVDILRTTFIRTHIFFKITDAYNGKITLFVNPYGEIFVAPKGCEKPLYCIRGASLFGRNDNIALNYAERIKSLVQQSFIINEMLCRYTVYKNRRYVQILCLRPELQYKSTHCDRSITLLPDEYTIIDCINRYNHYTVLLLKKENTDTASAMVYCDPNRDFRSKTKKPKRYTHKTIEEARHNFLSHASMSIEWPRFDQQFIEGPVSVLYTMMNNIRSGYMGPIQELSKNTVECLNFPLYTQEEFLYNQETRITFRPNNLLDRVWYTLHTKIAQLPRDLYRDYIYFFAGGFGLFGGLFDIFHNVVKKFCIGHSPRVE
jgi:hypothetical protein